MMIRIIYVAILLFTAASLLSCPEASAQSSDVTRLEEQIRRNEELIQEAERLVAETNSSKARASLQAAILLHKETLHLLSNKQNMLAARAAMKTREAVLHAIALAKTEAQTEETAKRTIERAHRHLEMAKNLLEESGTQEMSAARKLIDEAQVQLQRSLDNMREHLFASALHLAASSERLSNQAITLLKKAHQGTSDVERELAKTDRVLGRIESYDGLDQFPSAEKRYREAMDIQTRANHAYRSGRPKRTIELTQRARTIALSVAKLLSSNPSAENVEQAITLTDGLLDRAGEMASGDDTEAAAQQLARAIELQQQAKSYFSDRNYAGALRLTLRARDLVKQGIGKLQKPLDEKDVEAALRSTDSLIDHVKEKMDQSGDQTEQELFLRLVSHQQSAWSDFKKGNLHSALARTKLARNLARRILERIDG